MLRYLWMLSSLFLSFFRSWVRWWGGCFLYTSPWMNVIIFPPTKRMVLTPPPPPSKKWLMSYSRIKIVKMFFFVTGQSVSIYLSIHLSIHLYIYLSIHLSIYTSTSVSIYLCISVSI